MNQVINMTAIEKLVSDNQTLVFSQEQQDNFCERRDSIRDAFTADRIRGLSLEQYFQGRGLKEGNFTYELEWKTRELGSICGGSNNKFGYEQDFDEIKDFIAFIVGQVNKVENFYNKDGSLSGIAIQMVERSKRIKGLKTGRTTLGKILSIYFPEIFINIFTDQGYYLEILYSDYQAFAKGLELFFINNWLLLKVKEKIKEILPDVQSQCMTNDRFSQLMYHAYPKEGIRQNGQVVIEGVSGEPPLEVLEVQHYQTLIHKNFKRLFPHLRYYDEENQNTINGHFNTDDVGTLDFLAVNEQNDYVVIELKRKASDQTLGQILRYMGWVKENLCDSDQDVKGIILADSFDVRLNYAMNVISNIELKTIKLEIEIS